MALMPAWPIILATQISSLAEAHVTACSMLPKGVPQLVPVQAAGSAAAESTYQTAPMATAGVRMKKIVNSTSEKNRNDPTLVGIISLSPLIGTIISSYHWSETKWFILATLSKPLNIEVLESEKISESDYYAELKKEAEAES